MLAVKRTIVFLVGRSRLSLRSVGPVVDDFYEVNVSEGREFSYNELSELERIKRCPDGFVSSFMFDEIRPYALPFFEKESLNTEGDLVDYE